MRRTTTMPTWEYLEHLKDEIGDLAEHLPVAAKDEADTKDLDFTPSPATISAFVAALREADDDEWADVVREQLEEFASVLEYDIQKLLNQYGNQIENFDAEFGRDLQDLHSELVAECAQPYRNSK